MNEDQKIESINEKILSLVDLPQPTSYNLSINGQNLIDEIIEVKDPEVKFGLLTDLLLLDIKFDRDDTLKILKTNKSPIVLTLFENKSHEDKIEILNLAMDEEVSKDTFLQLSKKDMNIIAEHSQDMILNYTREKDYIPESSNEKLFLLLLMYDRKQHSREQIEKFNEELSVSMPEKANVKLLKLLLSSKIDMSKVNDYGENGLFHLNGATHKEIVDKHKLLLESGMDATLKNKQGLSYLEKQPHILEAIEKLKYQNVVRQKLN